MERKNGTKCNTFDLEDKDGAINNSQKLWEFIGVGIVQQERFLNMYQSIMFSQSQYL